jgi:catechol 2,3-dioxygenase-like lactoylglutathione lyase family enzyme
MDSLLPIKLKTVVLDCPDIQALSDFYVKMLGWKKTYADDEWTDIQSPGGGTKIGFQRNDDFVPPVWPEEPLKQQQMLHLDFCVSGAEQMEKAVAHAISCGARKAQVQYDARWTVMIDPVGHPFCFVI